MTLDQFIQLASLAATVGLVMSPFHFANVKARQRLESKVDRMWGRLKRHDKRTAKLSARITGIEDRVPGSQSPR
jgi:hypothetical protein